jgi:hypothetical protein
MPFSLPEFLVPGWLLVRAENLNADVFPNGERML